VGLENLSEICIDFFVIVAYFLGESRKWMSEGHDHKIRYNIFCRIDLFPLFIASILSEA
jgi:hypothetical protein